MHECLPSACLSSVPISALHCLEGFIHLGCNKDHCGLDKAADS